MNRLLASAGYGPFDVRDLAEVACDAAVELDELGRRRRAEFLAVRRLAALLTESVGGQGGTRATRSLFDPSAAVAVTRAIRSSRAATAPEEVEMLKRIIDDLKNRLLALAAEPRKAKAPEIRSLRSFCLILSQLVLAARPSPFEPGPEVPLERR